MRHRLDCPTATLAAALALSGCSDDPSSAGPLGVTPAPEGSPHETLDEWHLFADARAQLPTEGVVPYEVIAPLYSDYTFKRRFVWLPAGATIGYEADAPWQFPLGAILVKTFSYLSDERDPALGERLLETRLLVNESSGWQAHTYLWNAEQTAATREVAGDIVPSSFIDAAGMTRSNDYIVPTTNECQDCHGEKPAIAPLGGRTRQLDRDSDYGTGPVNQIDHFASLGWFATTPPASGERTRLVDPFGAAPLGDRVRAYLDANCGHCHTEGGGASQSALLLSYPFTDPAQDDANWGVCKVPTSAGGATCGLSYDVVPGDAAASIMMCRLESSDPEVRMPPLVSRVPHSEGNALIAAWIDQMTPAGCSQR
jgi:uncharacterized repeat protein (TIGR03806 family)